MIVQTTAALCTVLSVALERLPEAFLRSNFSSAVSTVEAVIKQHPEDVSVLLSRHCASLLSHLACMDHSPLIPCATVQAGVLKPAVASLSYVLAAADFSDWPSVARPFALLLGFATNLRPKVRKHAHDGLVQVLAALQHTQALQPSSGAVLQGEPCAS